MKKEIKEKIIDYIKWNFDQLRGDWSDNRWNCREGWEAVDRLREVLGIKVEKPYRHNEDISLEGWLKKIEENQMLITDKNGNSKTMGEMLLPQYNKAIDEGKGKDFKLLSEPEDDNDKSA